MGKAYLFVEGQGDEEAGLNLVIRLWQELGLSQLSWAKPLRGRNLHQERGIVKACELARSKDDCEAMLILRDEDDLCPKVTAPLAAGWIRSLQLPFPSALVLAHREFEAFFLPCLARMAGKELVDSRGIRRPGLLAEARFEGDPQAKRGVKELLSKYMPPSRSYKPTMDQLPLARMVVFEDIRSHEPPLPCFGSLERSLKFLDAERQGGGRAVYPGVTIDGRMQTP